MPDLTEQIVDILAPIVGKFLAEAKVRASYIMLNIDVPDKDDLQKIATKIEQNMAQSIGPVAAASIARQIRELGNKYKDAD